MKKIILSLVVGALVLPAVSFGAYWQAGESVSVGALQPVRDNAYLAGSVLTVSAPVGGDLFAAGSSVSVSGDVKGDIMAVGSMLNVIGAKAEDVRVAGSSVNLSGDFSGELLAAGAQVIVAADTNIAEGAHIAGSVLNFNGRSGGDVNLYGEKISIGPGAVIKGDLNYSSVEEANIDPAAKISGKVNFSQTKAAERNAGAFKSAFAGAFTAVVFIKILAMLLAAYLLWYLRRKDSVEIIQQATSKFGANLLRGFIFLVVVPAAVLVLFLTVVGFPIGIFAALLYAALLMLACPFTVLFVSSLVMKRRTDLRWYHILLGALILVIVKVIPVIGWLAGFLVYLAALGAMLTALKAKFKR